MRISKDFGLNPSIEICPVCGKEGAIALFGDHIKTEAPVKHHAASPCQSCKDRDKRYLAESEDNFILYIVDDLYQSHEMDRNPPPFWLYLKASYYTDLDTVKRAFTGIDFTRGAACLTVSTARAVGIDLDALPMGKA